MKKFIRCFLFFCLNFVCFSNEYKQNSLFNLIQEKKDIAEIDTLIQQDSSIIFDVNENKEDIIDVLFKTRKVNFDKDSDFLSYTYALIDILPISYWNSKNLNENYPIFSFLAKCHPVNDYNLIEKVVKKTNDLNIENGKYQTPLTYVTSTFDENGILLIKLLLENGADINYKNYNGYTAIMCAAEYNKNNEIFEFLYKTGAFINVNTGKGETITILASRNENPKILNFLLENTENFDSEDFYGKTSLIHACENGLLDNVELLLKKKIDVNHKDNFSKSALDYACEKSEDLRMIKSLLFSGAKISKTSIVLAFKNPYFFRYKMILLSLLIVIIQIIAYKMLLIEGYLRIKIPFSEDTLGISLLPLKVKMFPPKPLPPPVVHYIQRCQRCGKEAKIRIAGRCKPDGHKGSSYASHKWEKVEVEQIEYLK